MAKKNYAAEYQFRVTLVVDGVACGVWNKLDGGDKDSTETKISPGGMEEDVSIGGKATYDNVSLEKPYALDDRELADFLDDRVGKGVAEMVQQPLDADGNAYGRPFTKRGTLKKFSTPKHEAAGEAGAMLSVECSVTGKG